MIDKNVKLIKGKDCQLNPDAYIGYKEHGGKIILGNKVIIMHGTVLRTCTGIIKIGNNSSVGYYCVFHGKGGITIGNNVMISPNVHFYAQNHGLDKHHTMNKQPQTAKGIIIGNDVWIGAGAIILDRVKIETGAVVGAGSVITKSISSYEIWAGNPGKKIGTRI